MSRPEIDPRRIDSPAGCGDAVSQDGTLVRMGASWTACSRTKTGNTPSPGPNPNDRIEIAYQGGFSHGTR
jgi:hypothetical protein